MILLVRCVLGLDVDARARRVAVAPLAIPGMTRLEVEGLPVGGARLRVSVRVDHGQAAAEVEGLPDGWQRLESLRPTA